MSVVTLQGFLKETGKPKRFFVLYSSLEVWASRSEDDGERTRLGQVAEATAPTGPNFTMTTTKGSTVELVAETVFDAWAWVSAVCKATGAPLPEGKPASTWEGPLYERSGSSFSKAMYYVFSDGILSKYPDKTALAKKEAAWTKRVAGVGVLEKRKDFSITFTVDGADDTNKDEETLEFRADSAAAVHKWRVVLGGDVDENYAAVTDEFGKLTVQTYAKKEHALKAFAKKPLRYASALYELADGAWKPIKTYGTTPTLKKLHARIPAVMAARVVAGSTAPTAAQLTDGAAGTAVISEPPAAGTEEAKDSSHEASAAQDEPVSAVAIEDEVVLTEEHVAAAVDAAEPDATVTAPIAKAVGKDPPPPSAPPMTTGTPKKWFRCCVDSAAGERSPLPMALDAE